MVTATTIGQATSLEETAFAPVCLELTAAPAAIEKIQPWLPREAKATKVSMVTTTTSAKHEN